MTEKADLTFQNDKAKVVTPTEISRISCSCFGRGRNNTVFYIKCVPWTLAELYFSRDLQRPYTGTCTILQKTINGFPCLLVVFLTSKQSN